jgi:G3E family GTPase
VYQAVHQLFEGTPDREWLPGEARSSRMVFIGRDLDGEAFDEALRNCLAAPEGVREVEVV